MYLRSGTTVVWRSSTEAQFGLDPRWAVRVSKLTARDRRVVTDLQAGLAISGTEPLAGVLTHADLLVDSLPTEHSPAAIWSQVDPAGSGSDLLARRRAQVVSIRCPAPASAVFVDALAAAGVTVADAPEPAAVVLVSGGAFDPAVVADLMLAGVPHIPVSFLDTSVHVGPVVVPGSGACLRCLELHRSAADDKWPRIAYALASRTWYAEPSLLAWAASAVVPMAVSVADGRARTGLAVTMRIDDVVPQVEQWAAHPTCGCAGLTPLSVAGPGPA